MFLFQVQNVLLIAIIVGIFNVIIGSFNGPKSNIAKATGFTGLNSNIFHNDLSIITLNLNDFTLNFSGDI